MEASYIKYIWRLKKKASFGLTVKEDTPFKNLICLLFLINALFASVLLSP